MLAEPQQLHRRGTIQEIHERLTNDLGLAVSYPVWYGDLLVEGTRPCAWRRR